MVYYFSSNVVSPAAFIYVGKDKVENEDLIKYGWEEDVWFHVDNLSSAHIYLRLPEGSTWEDIPADLLQDCAQLTKANSIEGIRIPLPFLSSDLLPSLPDPSLTPRPSPHNTGNKKDNVTIIYTPWSNLKKDGSMAVGQVGFKDNKKVKRVYVAARENPIVNRLNKTKVEKYPDLQMEREDRLRELRKKDRAAVQERKKEEARIAKERKEMAWRRDHAYDDVHTDDAVLAASNQDREEDFLDDFM
ncbi:hypothetical protein BKA80DRAFT_255608 [Phyllosticta citrichinensis]